MRAHSKHDGGRIFSYFWSCLFVFSFCLFAFEQRMADGARFERTVVRTDGRGFHRADAHARAVNETAAVIQHHIVQVLYLYMHHSWGEIRHRPRSWNKRRRWRWRMWHVAQQRGTENNIIIFFYYY